MRSHRLIVNAAASSLKLSPEQQLRLLRRLETDFPSLTLVEGKFKPNIKQLKRWRKRRNLTQEQLARKANMCLKQYSNVELGRTSTTRKRLTIIAEILKVPLARIAETV